MRLFVVCRCYNFLVGWERNTNEAEKIKKLTKLRKKYIKFTEADKMLVV
jgi:adenylosuccinate synthase